MNTHRPSLLRCRDRWHVLMGEVYGWLSGWALIQVAKHASKARDVITVERVRAVIHKGVEVGWDVTTPDKGRIVPDRDQEVADRAMELLRERYGD
jgi:hypothetical protein